MKPFVLHVIVEQENDKNENSKDKHYVLCQHDILYGFTPSLKKCKKKWKNKGSY